MPLYIKDDTTALLVTQFAKLRGSFEQDAVKSTVQAELDRAEETIPPRKRFAVFRAAHSLPPRTGEVAEGVLRRAVR